MLFRVFVLSVKLTALGLKPFSGTYKTLEQLFEQNGSFIWVELFY